ncbi:MAG: hypothetical protein DWI67_03735 [Chloroflexi bacterium]|jgi:hypothetical protein|nr:MAG: hypothetical protein DWI61_03640 [Chloroflexota bacterium]RLT53483.1 MAG: hypothetical protein DWI67_03735 [Chloroflexota bacterium]
MWLSVQSVKPKAARPPSAERSRAWLGDMRIVIGGALLAGLLVGWMLLGWWLVPVQWVNAGPVQLNPVYQTLWVQMAADSYSVTLNEEDARNRIGLLQEQSANALKRALGNTQGSQQARIADLQVVIENAPAKPAANASASAAISMGVVLPAVLAVMVLVGAVGFVAWSRMRVPREAARREKVQPQVRQLTPVKADPPPPVVASAPSTDRTVERGAPIARFMTTYMFGDDTYDDSFSIDDANGDFLGECGVGVCETIGVGDPKKVAAFEVWLFDKNDVRTVTKVLLSQSGYADNGMRGRVAPKGDPVVAKTGETTILETNMLHVSVRVVDMNYGSGPLPPETFFNTLTVELTAWKKK